MSDDHELQVFEEEALAGRAANVRAWKAYFAAFPRYQIEPQNVAEQGSQVAILGSTVGSHLQLPPEVERGMTLIWLSEVRDGQLTHWRLLPDTPENRRSFGLPAG